MDERGESVRETGRGHGGGLDGEVLVRELRWKAVFEREGGRGKEGDEVGESRERGYQIC